MALRRAKQAVELERLLLSAAQGHPMLLVLENLDRIFRATTWYELREPLLRHHLQYRESRVGTVDLIVTILRAWYTTAQRTRMLGVPTVGEHAETHLARSCSTDEK